MEQKTRERKLSKQTMDFALDLLQRGCKGSMVAQVLGISKQSCSTISRAYSAAMIDDWDYLRKNSLHSANVVNWALEKTGKTIPAIDETLTVDESDECDSEICFDEVVTLVEIKESLDNIARLLENIVKIWK